MSGHNGFTRWINSRAKYIIVDGKKERIEETFFTSDGMPNSDTFNIKTENGCYELGDERIDFKDLSNRNGN